MSNKPSKKAILETLREEVATIKFSFREHRDGKIHDEDARRRISHLQAAIKIVRNS